MKRPVGEELGENEVEEKPLVPGEWDKEKKGEVGPDRGGVFPPLWVGVEGGSPTSAVSAKPNEVGFVRNADIRVVGG